MADEQTGTPTVEDATETDFAQLSEVSLEIDHEDGEETAPAAVEAPAAPVEPVVEAPPVAAPVEQPKPPEAPVAPVPPVAQPQPAAVPQPAAPAASAPEQMLAKRTALLAEIQGRYAVSDAEAERYALEPHKVLPELAAKVMLDTFDATVAIVTAMLPQMIQSQVTQQAQVQDVQQAFFKQWPQLAKPEYSQHIQRAASLYRQMNPTAPVAKALSDIGVLVATTLGLPLQAPAPAPAPVMRPVPFVPGGAGAVSQAAPIATEPNIFAHLAELED